jgi:hypothetical protein
VTSKKIKWVAQFIEIVRTRADHPPCQPTIAAQLLLDSGNIEPYTIIIMPLFRAVPPMTTTPVPVGVGTITALFVAFGRFGPANTITG